MDAAEAQKVPDVLLRKNGEELYQQIVSKLEAARTSEEKRKADAEAKEKAVQEQVLKDNPVNLMRT